MSNPTRRKINLNSLANLRPPFNGQPGPGRPPLSPDVKEQRRQIRHALNEATPEAIQLLRNALSSKNERNAIRSAEIILSYSVPKLKEEISNQDEYRPLERVPDEQLQEILASISSRIDSETPAANNGAP